ncbi:hypothetical protein OTU49_001384 [Cherax quadricarinatus]|uniref:Secreted protein n=1 Tax=Cherax quadricarinatus TaxID=27406 RepID=A0AAW0XG84_CHEQU
MFSLGLPTTTIVITITTIAATTTTTSSIRTITVGATTLTPCTFPFFSPPCYLSPSASGIPSSHPVPTPIATAHIFSTFLAAELRRLCLLTALSVGCQTS